MAGEHATDAEEEYLQTLFWLYEAGLPMTRATLSRAMRLSAPIVPEMVRRLEQDRVLVAGLAEGDIVVSVGGQKLDPAARVRVVDARPATE